MKIETPSAKYLHYLMNEFQLLDDACTPFSLKSMKFSNSGCGWISESNQVAWFIHKCEKVYGTPDLGPGKKQKQL